MVPNLWSGFFPRRDDRLAFENNRDQERDQRADFLCLGSTYLRLFTALNENGRSGAKTHRTGTYDSVVEAKKSVTALSMYQVGESTIPENNEFPEEKPAFIIAEPNEGAAIRNLLEYPLFQSERWLTINTFINLLWGYNDLGWRNEQQGIPAALQRLYLFPNDMLILFSVMTESQIIQIIPAIEPLLELPNVIYSDKLANINVLKLLYQEAQEREKTVSLTDILNRSLGIFQSTISQTGQKYVTYRISEKQQKNINALVTRVRELTLEKISNNTQKIV